MSRLLRLLRAIADAAKLALYIDMLASLGIGLGMLCDSIRLW